MYYFLYDQPNSLESKTAHPIGISYANGFTKWMGPFPDKRRKKFKMGNLGGKIGRSAITRFFLAWRKGGRKGREGKGKTKHRFRYIPRLLALGLNGLQKPLGGAG